MTIGYIINHWLHLIMAYVRQVRFFVGNLLKKMRIEGLTKCQNGSFLN
jgi:hypothetical protein